MIFKKYCKRCRKLYHPVTDLGFSTNFVNGRHSRVCMKCTKIGKVKPNSKNISAGQTKYRFIRNNLKLLRNSWYKDLNTNKGSKLKKRNTSGR